VIRESRQADDPLSGLPVEVACALLEVNRGSYYRCPEAPWPPGLPGGSDVATGQASVLP